MKCIYTLILMTICHISYAQNITGLWETFDDNTNEKKAVVEIYEEQGLYFAKIAENFVKEGSGICETCKGAKKNQPIIGLVIIESLKKDGDEYDGGWILDPENGKTYKCTLQLVETDQLKVRGFIGFSFLGRTQYWQRKPE